MRQVSWEDIVKYKKLLLGIVFFTLFLFQQAQSGQATPSADGPAPEVALDPPEQEK